MAEFIYPLVGPSSFFLGLYNNLPWAFKRYVALFFFLCLAAGIVEVVHK